MINQSTIEKVLNEALSYAVKKKLIYVSPMTSISNTPKIFGKKPDLKTK